MAAVHLTLDREATMTARYQRILDKTDMIRVLSQIKATGYHDNRAEPCLICQDRRMRIAQIDDEYRRQYAT